MERVAIVGVGLIGGSFALALKRAGFTGRIVGVSSPRTLGRALELGVIDEAAPLEEAVPAADLVYLAQPVLGILETLPQLAPLLGPRTFITDAGSTKAAIVETAQAHLPPGRFLGGHPMAGKEKSGVEEAEGDLFEGRVWAFTPVEPSEFESVPARELTGWVERIGSRVVTYSPADHDRIVALTSHLPQLASTALAAALERAFGNPAELELAGPGLAGMTRLALSPYEMWEGILKTNGAPIGQALDALLAELERLRRDIGGDPVRDSFERARDLAGRLKR
jgi:prephenate dehydrogenase